MYARIKRLYDTGKLTKDGVKNAVIKGWITAEQYETITGEAYDEDLQDSAEGDCHNVGYTRSDPDCPRP